MNLKIFALLSIFLLFLVPSSVLGVPDVENKEIVAESQDKDIVLSLEFGKNIISRFDRIIPTLQSGVLVVGDSIIEIENARTKIMGNSFVVHSENILIYAKGLESNQFLINSYLLGSNELEPIKLTSIPTQNVSIETENKSKQLDLIVLLQQDIRTYWNDSYDIEIKVFDKKVNPKPQFYQSLGAINQANIDVTLKDLEGKELTQLNGQTNSKGFWKGDFYVRQNLVSGGTYIVEVNVTYLESTNFQQIETFIIQNTREVKN